MNQRIRQQSGLDPISRSCTGVLIDEDGHEFPVPCEFAYDAADPYATTFSLHGAQRSVVWVFARTLLTEGCFEPAGEADVHVWPTVSAHGESRVAIELANQGLTALVLVPSRVVLGFLADTEVLVPRGTESTAFELDATLTALLQTSSDGVDRDR